MLDNSKVSQVFENTAKQEEEREIKKIKRLYVDPLIATLSSILLVGITFGSFLYFGNIEGSLKGEYSQKYSQLLEKKELEDKSEVKKIVTDIGKSSNLVYNLSIFHVSPKVILEKVEEALYLGQDKIITNESVNFTDYTTVTTGLVTRDLMNYATLIKKLKKLYSDTFEVIGLQDFGVQYEQDENGTRTGKVFYTTNLTLKYLKDPGSNLNTSGVLEDPTDEELESDTEVFENNVYAFETLDLLIQKLADKRKEEGKNEKYVTAITEDNSIYLGTDIAYLDNNIYYLSEKNMFIDLLKLNGIGNEDDYSTLVDSKNKLLLITSNDGQKYGLCAKVLKEELTELEKENTTKIHTKVLGTGSLQKKISDLCDLL